MLDKADAFQHPLLLTLTVDRGNFASPEAAHAYISQKGLIRRLLGRLGVRTWIWVLEFQGKTGAGWPHWHVLLDASPLPRKRIDLDRAWHLWRGTWEIGGLDVRAANKFNSPTHAIFYVTKYLTKFPKDGFPVWVLEAEHRIRFFQACRKLGPLAAPEVQPRDTDNESDIAKFEIPDTEDNGATVPGRDAEGPPTRRRRMRSLIERAAECGTAANAVLITPDGEGSTVRKWLGTTPSNASRITYLTRSRLIHSDVEVIRMTREFGDSTVMEHRPFVLGNRGTPARDAFKVLREELERCGELQRQLDDIAERRAQLLEGNQFAQRERDAEHGSVEDDE